jgi:hypothetical protein
MKAHIQFRGSLPMGPSAFAALYGFKDMGIECLSFRSLNEILDSSPAEIVVGGIGIVRDRLQLLGVCTDEIDYPAELHSFLGRRVWSSTIDTVSDHPEWWPIFVKPVEGKRFTGRVVNGTADLVGCGTCGEDVDVTCSEVRRFVAEWRCFVRKGRILDVRPYRGSWRISLDTTFVEEAVASYSAAPAGYAADFGVTEKGETLLVEVNDGYSLGSYGLEPHAYAALLAARWAELTQTDDACPFADDMPNPLL